MIAVVKTRSGQLASTDEVACGAVDPAAPSVPPAQHASLGQFTATSIAGNDLLSSCLYTAGACAQYAGKLAPFSLMLVSFMLYFFRYVYSEVVTALPVNGGSYNALLNTTSKRFAAMAACLSLISYVATAVVSGCYAILYLGRVWEDLSIHIGTIVVLGIFALLTLVGVGESSVVATGMFFTHVFALALLCCWAFAAMCKDGFSILSDNWRSPYPTVTTSSGSFVADGTAIGALFYGYAAALLGITGFETAANYVEEMRDSGVYVKTLRNMWWAAALFNPLISFLVMGVVPMSEITSTANSKVLLCVTAQKAASITHPEDPSVSNALSGFIAVDACIVLAGSVLTAYVGVTGLVRRLALDRCLPEFLMSLNKARGTPHWIILGFFVLTSSLFLLLYPPSSPNLSAVDNLGNVYDLAFLSVMSAFAISALILKWKRPDLPRRVISSYPTVLIALAFVLIGLVGNIIVGPGTLPYFVLYTGAIALVVFAMFQRSSLLVFIYYILKKGILASVSERRKAARRHEMIVEAHKELEEKRLAAALPSAGLLSPKSGSLASEQQTPASQGVTGGPLNEFAIDDASAAQGAAASNQAPAVLTPVEVSSLLGDSVAAIPVVPHELAAIHGIASTLSPLMAVNHIAKRRGFSDASDDSAADADFANNDAPLDDQRAERLLITGTINGERSSNLADGLLTHQPQSAGNGSAGISHQPGRPGRYLEISPVARASEMAEMVVKKQQGVAPGFFLNALGDSRRFDDVSAAHQDRATSQAINLRSPWRLRLYRWLTQQIDNINSQRVVYFAKKADLVSLNKAVLYVRDNELTSRLVIVHVVDDRQAILDLLASARRPVDTSGPSDDGTFTPVVRPAIPSTAISLSPPAAGDGRPAHGAVGAVPSVSDSERPALSAYDLLDQLPSPSSEVQALRHNCALLDAMYPKLRIDCLVVRGSFFSPAMVSFLSRYLGVTPNLMFMAMPDARFPHQFAALGGVRVITRTAKKGERKLTSEHLSRVFEEISQEQSGGSGSHQDSSPKDLRWRKAGRPSIAGVLASGSIHSLEIGLPNDK